MLSTVPRSRRRSLPARLIFLMLASAMAVLGLAVAAPPASAASVPIANASLSWKISDYAFGPAVNSLTQTQAVSGNVTKESGSWVFTGGTGTYDPATGATALNYTGAIDLGNTGFGNFTIRVSNPVVTVTSGGAGAVTADIAVRQSGASTFDAATTGVQLVTISAVPNATTWTVTPRWDGVGTEGSISAGVPLAGRQFSQSLLDALPSSMRSFFYATSATGSNLTKPPAPVTVNLNTTPQPVLAASLSWKISDYAFGPAVNSLTQTQAVSGNVTKESGSWVFTGGTGTYDPATGATTVTYSGTITLGNTGFGNFSIRVSNPVITVASGGAGTVTADIAVRQSGASTFDAATTGVQLVTISAVPNATTWTVTPPWDGVGTEGSISAGVPLAGRQFSQTLLDALPSSMRSFFYATSATGSNLTKPPAPVTVNLAGSSGGSGSTPTPPFSGDLGGGSGVPTVSAAATARPVVSGSLDWGIKGGFYSYITGGIASGTANGENGATSNGNGTFKFPATGGSWDPATNTGVLNFGGSVHYVGHSGALDMTVSNPQLHFTSGGSVLYASLSSKSLSSGVMQSFNGAMGTISGMPSLSGSLLTLSGLGVTLSADAAPAFAGFYAAGEGLDALNGTDTLGAAGSSGGTSTGTTTGTGTGAGTGTGTGAGTGTGSGPGAGTGAGSSSTTPLFTPTGSNTNPATAIVVSPTVTVVPQRVANNTEVTEVVRPPAVKLTNAPVVRAEAGDVVQPEVSGLPKRTKVDAFIVVDGKRVFLAELTTDKNGDVTLPALLLKKKGTYNVGVELPNGSVRWIKITTS